MAEFFGAALPYILMGLALALYFGIAVRRSVKANQEQREQNEAAQSDNAEAEPPKQSEKLDNRGSIGMCCGLAVGVALGCANIIPLTYGVGFGMLIGLAAGMLIKT